MKKYHEKLIQEFDRQAEILIQKGYPEVAGISDKELFKYIEALKKKVRQLNLPGADLGKGHLPFVIVIKSDLVANEKAMSLVERENKQGFTKLYPHEPKDFNVIDDVRIPNGMAYLLIDIDRGKGNINLPPNEAMKLIKKAKRSPLTIDEGIAIVTHFPEFLIKNNCFSLLASRTGTDQRVPAIWINAKKEPHLGWCWDGNPHTWLGSASAVSRVGV